MDLLILFCKQLISWTQLSFYSSGKNIDIERQINFYQYCTIINSWQELMFEENNNNKETSSKQNLTPRGSCQCSDTMLIKYCKYAILIWFHMWGHQHSCFAPTWRKCTCVPFGRASRRHFCSCSMHCPCTRGVHLLVLAISPYHTPHSPMLLRTLALTPKNRSFRAFGWFLEIWGMSRTLPTQHRCHPIKNWASLCGTCFHLCLSQLRVWMSNL